MNDPESLKALVSDLTNTRAFQRLRSISFLGIVDYQLRTTGRPGRIFSRAEHSLGVALLAEHAVRAIGMNDSDARLLIAAALLHDIAHPAFSHSLEYAFDPARRDTDHHKAFRSLVLDSKERASDLHRALGAHRIDAQRLVELVDGGDELSFFFSCPLNIDTLDGIRRSYWSMGKLVQYDVDFLTLSIASIYAGAGLSNLRFLREADRFWEMKGHFYNTVLTGRDAALERIFQSVVRRRIARLEPKFFEMTDGEFINRYPEVIREVRAHPLDGEGVSNDQRFEIDHNVVTVDKISIFKRYRRVRRSAHRQVGALSSSG